MSGPTAIPALERPVFFDGQQLSAADLDAANAFSRELRWLHNRALHGWGIALGLAVSGQAGERTVRVQPGYALDALGRDILVHAQVELPVPARAGANNGAPAIFFLTASYADDLQLAPVVQNGVCGGSGAVRRPDRPNLRWQDPGDSDPASRYRYGHDVVLAEVEVRHCALAADVSVRARRDALPPQQPYVAAGRTEAGNTPWQLWPNDAAPFGVVTVVSTAQAGFAAVPRYQAHVQGERMHDSGVVDGTVHIARAGATDFELRVVLPVGSTVGSGQIHVFDLDDYSAVVARICNLYLFDEPRPQAVARLLKRNGRRVTVNQPLLVDTLIEIYVTVLRSDVEPVLQKLADSNGVTLDDLVAANNWDLNAMSLELDMPIAIPGEALPLNPPNVLLPEFMQTLTGRLGWHVVWMGVEG